MDEPPNQDSLDTIILIGKYVVGGLVAAIGVLWRTVLKNSKDCEAKHERTHGEMVVMAKEVGELKGSISLAKELTPKIDDLSKDVLTALDEIAQNKDT